MIKRFLRWAPGFWALLFLAVPVMGVATFVLADQYNIWLPRDVSEHGRVIDDFSVIRSLLLLISGRLRALRFAGICYNQPSVFRNARS